MGMVLESATEVDVIAFDLRVQLFDAVPGLNSLRLPGWRH